MKYYDNTRLSDYKDCPRYYYLRHKMHLVPDRIAKALIFGLSWHEAMDIVWAMVKQNKDDKKIVYKAMEAFKACWEENELEFDIPPEKIDWYLPRTPMIAVEMLYNYVEQRRSFIEDCEIEAIEQPFAVELGGGYEGFRYVGRLDKRVWHRTNGHLVIEHKTTTAYAKASGFRADYISSWSPNSQVDGYSHSGNVLAGGKLKGVWIDAALVHKTVHDKFKFIPIDRAIIQLNEWLKETREWIDRVEGEEVDPKYPKNTGRCHGKYGTCIYKDICQYKLNPITHSEESYDKFKVEKWEPFKVLELEKIGLEDENG